MSKINIFTRPVKRPLLFFERRIMLQLKSSICRGEEGQIEIVAKLNLYEANEKVIKEYLNFIEAIIKEDGTVHGAELICYSDYDYDPDCIPAFTCKAFKLSEIIEFSREYQKLCNLGFYNLELNDTPSSMIDLLLTPNYNNLSELNTIIKLCMEPENIIDGTVIRSIFLNELNLLMPDTNCEVLVDSLIE